MKQLSKLAVYGTFIGLLSATLYPIVIYPMMDSKYYSKLISDNTLFIW